MKIIKIQLYVNIGILICNDASNKYSIRKLINIKTILTKIEYKQYGTFYENCYHLDGTMIGYSLDKGEIRYKCILIQIDSYIMSIIYNNLGVDTIECDISTLYYI